MRKIYSFLTGRRRALILPYLLIAVFTAGSATAQVTNSRTMHMYSTIQEAVNNASANDTLMASPGTYPETINVTKSLTILGPNGYNSPNIVNNRVSEAVIDAQPVGTKRSAFIANTANTTVTIKGFTILNGEPLSDGNKGADNNIDITFEKNIVKDASVLYGNIWRNVKIIDNYFKRITPPYASKWSDAIFIVNAINVDVTDNVINGADIGILVNGVSNRINSANILRNKIDTVGQDGIQLSGLINMGKISQNVINLSYSVGGIHILYPAISGAVSVTNNIVTNSHVGFNIKSGQSIVGQNLTVNYNSFDQSNYYGICNGAIGTLSAACNWYGTTNPTAQANPSSPEVTKSVIGDVNYTPFLLSGEDDNKIIGFQPQGPCGVVNNNTCTFDNGTYYGGFEGGKSSGSDLSYGLPREGSYEVVKSVSELGGGGYLSIKPHSGKYFLAAHTSNNANDRIWSSKVTLTAGKTYNFCAYVTLLKNLGNGANFLLQLYANGSPIGSTGRVTFDWTKLCGTFTLPGASGTKEVELAIKDPKKGLFFVAIDDICLSESAALSNAPSTVIAPAQSILNHEQFVQLFVQELTVKTAPNPSASSFTITISGINNATATVRVLDALGRQVQVKNNLQPGTTLNIGGEFKRGDYYVEVTQGDERKLVKLVKL